MKLSQNQLDFLTSVDPAGKLFYHQGRVYRGIPPQHADFFRGIINEGCMDDFFQAGLVPTWISDLEVEGFDLVLEHKKIDFPSKWNEWCSYMIKDAALLFCGLNLELAKKGYLTKDTHPGNVMFDYTNPLWVDFTSITPISTINPRSWIERLRKQTIVPLCFLHQGKHGVARALYEEVNGYFQNFTQRKPFRYFPLPFFKYELKAKKSSFVSFLEDVVEYLSSLEIRPQGCRWSNYRQAPLQTIADLDDFESESKNRVVHQLISRLPPGTFLDIACNKGWYTALAESLGHKVVAFDIDDSAICSLYLHAKSSRLNILPLFMNFAWPTPPFGIGLQNKSSFDRLRCDVTLALAIVHHLVFKNNLCFEIIIDIISNYTKKQSIIEYVPSDDKYVSKWMTPEYDWYTLNNFLKALEKHYREIAVYDSFPKPRKIILCSK